MNEHRRTAFDAASDGLQHTVTIWNDFLSLGEKEETSFFLTGQTFHAHKRKKEQNASFLQKTRSNPIWKQNIEMETVSGGGCTGSLQSGGSSEGMFCSCQAVSAI